MLPLELYYLIIDHVLVQELQHYQHVFAPSTYSTVFQLLLTGRLFQDYIAQQDRYQRLRLWRLLNRIPRQFEPVKVAVGSADCFTILSVDMSTEKVITTVLDTKRTETFLVLQESTASIRKYWGSPGGQTVYTYPEQASFMALSSTRQAKRRHHRATSQARSPLLASRDSDDDAVSGCSGFLMGKHSSYSRKTTDSKKTDAKAYLNDETAAGLSLDEDNVNDGRIVIALFPLATFIRHVQWYATRHNASVWLWKRSARFFRGSNLDTLHRREFRYILDTQRHALIAWDRPSGSNIRFTESVLNSNVELFSKLLPTN
ncbi:hypothetical protein DM01DRAFT_310246 [Hesseltinella vesiculosa]|uniref:Uncharacterized protein n=1 Tax=Hesseltinella vesiculosa TaxID=101127 RepID=A0A1X2GCL6_9FUNG|nr:hypothetical protein DM01DRAFT_310246 [Hesseltinella vesiculosa]